MSKPSRSRPPKLVFLLVVAASGGARLAGAQDPAPQAPATTTTNAPDLARDEARWAGAVQRTDNAEAWLAWSTMAERRGDLVEALRRARSALDRETAAGHARDPAPSQPGPGSGLDPGRLELPSARFAVARLLSALGENTRALEVLGDVSEALEEQVLRGLLLRKLGRIEAAMAALEAPALARQPDAAAGLAEIFLEQERYTEVVKLLGPFQGPNGPARLRALSAVALSHVPGYEQQAVTNLSQAIAAGAQPTLRFRLELGDLLLRLGDVTQALAVLSAVESSIYETANTAPQPAAGGSASATATAPATPPAPTIGLSAQTQLYYQLATAQRAAGDHEAAARSFRRLQDLQQQTAAQKRRHEELDRALSEAAALAKNNKLGVAFDRLQPLLDGTPETAPLVRLVAKLQLSLGQPETALQNIRKACSLEPANVEGHLLEGILLRLLRRDGEAREAIARALALDGDLAEAHALLGGIELAAHSYPEAVLAFERAVALGLDSPDLRRGYAMALEGAGRTDEAAAQLEAARRLLAAQPPR